MVDAIDGRDLDGGNKFGHQKGENPWILRSLNYQRGGERKRPNTARL